MWVARDKTDYLYLYDVKPEKYTVQWQIPSNERGTIAKIDSALLPEVKWEDEEPTEIDIVPKVRKSEKLEKSKSIDWEQRRYEIAKTMFYTCIKECSYTEEHRIERGAEYAIMCAETLINMIRKGE